MRCDIVPTQNKIGDEFIDDITIDFEDDVPYGSAGDEWVDDAVARLTPEDWEASRRATAHCTDKFMQDFVNWTKTCDNTNKEDNSSK